MTIRITLTVLLFSCVATVCYAQDFPGLLSGKLGDQDISVPLDCRLWKNDQSQVYAAGDQGGADRNGDGFALNYSFLNGPDTLTNMYLTVDGTRYSLGPVPLKDDKTGGWIVSKDGAQLKGAADNFGNPIIVDLLLDCADRGAAERGYTGVVAGTFADFTIDAPLYCGDWMPNGFSAAKSEDGIMPFVELMVMPNGTDGSVIVTTDARKYQIPVMSLAGTKFENSDGKIGFAADMKERKTGETYSVDLVFECPE